jgi:hypothetical protein
LGDQNRFWRIEPEEGFSLEDMRGALGTLEEEALGMKVHGDRTSACHKKPPSGHTTSGGGVSTRAAWTLKLHGALTSEAAYPLQSSSWQGLLLHEYSCPTPWIFAPTSLNIVPPLPHLSRG